MTRDIASINNIKQKHSSIAKKGRWSKCGKCGCISFLSKLERHLRTCQVDISQQSSASPLATTQKTVSHLKAFFLYPGASIMDMSFVRLSGENNKIQNWNLCNATEEWEVVSNKAQKNIQLYKLLSKRQFARKRRSLKFRLKSFAAISQFDQKISHYHWQFREIAFLFNCSFNSMPTNFEWV